MSHAVVHANRTRLHNPVFLDGLPGQGLVGKIATDHLISEFGMTYFASIECPALPPVVAYSEDSSRIFPPVRVYADGERDLLALQSDVPVSPAIVSDFASCLGGLLAQYNTLPLYFSGFTRAREGEFEDERILYGVATGTGERLLEKYAIPSPREAGVWSGPTGALLNVARVNETTAIGILVESDPQFPDPEAACTLIERVIEPVTGVTVDVNSLREQTETIREEKKTFAALMEQPERNESSMAESRRMYQ